MSGASNIQAPVSQQDIEKFEQGWTREMVNYWRERMLKLQVYDKGNLYRSMTGVLHPGNPTTIEHRFLYYGIYAAAGTGYGYSKGNGGDLQFLDIDYRKEHRLDQPRKRGPKWGGGYTSGNPRQRRDWFAKKYYASIMRLGEFEAAFYGQAFSGVMSEALQAVFEGKASEHMR